MAVVYTKISTGFTEKQKSSEQSIIRIGGRIATALAVNIQFNPESLNKCQGLLLSAAGGRVPPLLHSVSAWLNLFQF